MLSLQMYIPDVHLLFAESQQRHIAAVWRLRKGSKPFVTFAETPQRYQSPVSPATQPATGMAGSKNEQNATHAWWCTRINIIENTWLFARLLSREVVTTVPLTNERDRL